MAYQVIAIVPVKADRMDAARAVVAAALPAIRVEDGCLSYMVAESNKGAPRLFTVEDWRDKAALDAHLDRPHVKAMLDELKTSLDGEVEIIPVTQVEG